MKFIIRLIFCLLITFIPSFLFAQTSECTIQLNNGDTLSGNLLAINSEKLKLSISNFDDQALEVQQKDIKKLWFNNQWHSGQNKGEHVIVLTNGDIIFGKLLNLDLKTITFHSDFLGTKTFPRNSVMVISKADRKKITYRSPNILKNWDLISDNWKQDNWTLIETPKKAAIFQNFNLNLHSQIDLTLDTTHDKIYDIGLFTDKIRSNWYRLRISGKLLMLIQSDIFDRKKPVLWATLPNSDKNKISLQLLQKAGKIKLTINDKFAKESNKHDIPNKLGKGISILNPSAKLKINEIKITDHLQTEIDIDGFKVTNNTENAILDDLNTYTGTVTHADNEELKIEMEERKIQVFKTDKITWISLEGQKTPPSSKTAKVFLKNNAGLMHIEISKLSNDRLYGTHSSLGEIEVRATNISSIIFTPQK